MELLLPGGISRPLRRRPLVLAKARLAMGRGPGSPPLTRSDGCIRCVAATPAGRGIRACGSTRASISNDITLAIFHSSGFFGSAVPPNLDLYGEDLDAISRDRAFRLVGRICRSKNLLESAVRRDKIARCEKAERLAKKATQGPVRSRRDRRLVCYCGESRKKHACADDRRTIRTAHGSSWGRGLIKNLDDESLRMHRRRGKNRADAAK